MRHVTRDELRSPSAAVGVSDHQFAAAGSGEKRAGCFYGLDLRFVCGDGLPRIGLHRPQHAKRVHPRSPDRRLTQLG